jgi:hypothetical protein
VRRVQLDGDAWIEIDDDPAWSVVEDITEAPGKGEPVTLRKAVAGVILRWSMTDGAGLPLPPPVEQPDVLRLLKTSLVKRLIKAVMENIGSNPNE